MTPDCYCRPGKACVRVCGLLLLLLRGLGAGAGSRAH